MAESTQLAFVLTMLGNNAWNGKWTGDGLLFARVFNKGYTIKARKRAEEMTKNGPYRYHFGDGWVAQIDVKLVSVKEAKEIRKNTQGFYGYDWMIKSIELDGEIKIHERKS